jgi:F-type H+-transporting ATPase subunit epsilon
MAISGGFAQVAANGVTVLAETAESEEHIDAERARAARERAAERLNNAAEGVDEARAHAALSRAVNRLKLSGQT